MCVVCCVRERAIEEDGEPEKERERDGVRERMGQGDASEGLFGLIQATGSSGEPKRAFVEQASEEASSHNEEATVSVQPAGQPATQAASVAASPRCPPWSRSDPRTTAALLPPPPPPPPTPERGSGRRQAPLPLLTRLAREPPREVAHRHRAR